MKKYIVLLIFFLLIPYLLKAEINYKEQINNTYNEIKYFISNPEFKVIYTDGDFCVINGGLNQGLSVGDEIYIYKKIEITTAKGKESHLIPSGSIGIKEIKNNSSSGIRLSGNVKFENGGIAKRKDELKTVLIYSDNLKQDLFFTRILYYIKGVLIRNGIDIRIESNKLQSIDKEVSYYGRRYDRIIICSRTISDGKIDFGFEIYNGKDKYLLYSKLLKFKIDEETAYYYRNPEQSGAIIFLGEYDILSEDALAVKLHDIDGDKNDECIIITEDEIIIYKIRDQHIEPFIVASRFEKPIPYKPVVFETADLFFYDFDGEGKENIVVTSNTSSKGSLIYKINKDSILFSRKLSAVMTGKKNKEIITSNYNGFYYSGDSSYIISINKNNGNFDVKDMNIDEDYSDIIITDTDPKMVYINNQGIVKGIMDNNEKIVLVDNLKFGPKMAYDGAKYFYFVSNKPTGQKDVFYQYTIDDKKLKYITNITRDETIWDIDTGHTEKDGNIIAILKGNHNGGNRLELWKISR